MPRRALFALASEPQEAIVNAALAAHGVCVDTVPPGAHLQTMALQAMREAQPGEPPLLLIDLAVLAQLATPAAPFCTWKQGHCGAAELWLYCSGLHRVPAAACAWAQRMGARDLLPGCDLAHHRVSLLPSLRKLLAALGIDAVDEAALERALRPLPAMLDDTRVAQAWRANDMLRKFAEPIVVREFLCDHVEIKARRYRTRTYDECFIGAEAVDALVGLAKATDASHGREDAVRIGQALLDLGHIYHVARDQPFRDGHFFYRIAADTPRLCALDLGAVIAYLHEGGVRIADRKYHGLTYAHCFVGAHAVKSLRYNFELSENEAMTLGEQLLDLFVLHHVADQRPFRDGRFFYRFYQDEAASDIL